jgi:ribosomal-protein-alanine N-acetyltransferase
MKILPERPLPAGEALTVRISRMRRRHVRAILKIEQQVYPRPWSASVFAGEIEQIPRTRRYLVAHVGRRLVGYGGLMLTPDSAHVTNLAVDPTQQRAGVGTRVLLTLTREAIALGSPALTLEVRVGNVAAQRLYEQFGFVPAGIRKRYYEGRDDAIVMWAHDIGQPAYAERLRAIEDRIPGTTVWEDE